jgi:hypothetical protein
MAAQRLDSAKCVTYNTILLYHLSYLSGESRAACFDAFCAGTWLSAFARTPELLRLHLIERGCVPKLPEALRRS